MVAIQDFFSKGQFDPAPPTKNVKILCRFLNAPSETWLRHAFQQFLNPIHQQFTVNFKSKKHQLFSNLRTTKYFNFFDENVSFICWQVSDSSHIWEQQAINFRLSFNANIAAKTSQIRPRPQTQIRIGAAAAKVSRLDINTKYRGSIFNLEANYRVICEMNCIVFNYHAPLTFPGPELFWRKNMGEDMGPRTAGRDIMKDLTGIFNPKLHCCAYFNYCCDFMWFFMLHIC